MATVLARGEVGPRKRCGSTRVQSERRCVLAETVAGALWEEAGWWGRYLGVRIPGKGGLLQGESTGPEGNTAPRTWTRVTRRMEVDDAIGSRWGEQSFREIIWCL